MSVLTIYGDSISGNCLKIKFVCDHLGIPYRWVETDVVKGETRTPEFLKRNPAGQVPVVEWPDGRILAQSDAIIFHLAEGSALIPADAFERAQMLQWMFWEQYSHETVIAVRRFHKTYLKKPEHEIDPSLLPKGERVLGVMNDHLATRRYFVGEKLTLGTEAFYHGAEGLATPQTQSATLLDIGGYYKFRDPGYQLLFCYGHNVAGQREQYAYAGLYWTWGHKGPEKDSDTAMNRFAPPERW